MEDETDALPAGLGQSRELEADDQLNTPAVSPNANEVIPESPSRPH